MYIDHGIAVRISRIISSIDIPTLLMDAAGNVLIPEGDKRQLTLPESVRVNPGEPILYGGVTLMGVRGERGEFSRDGLYLCLNNDGADARNCAIVLSQLISTMLRVDISATDRAQALRMILRGDVTDSEIEVLASSHGIDIDGDRYVIYITSQGVEVEVLAAAIVPLTDPDADMYTDVSRNSLALIKPLLNPDDLDVPAKEAQRLSDELEDVGINALIGVSEPRAKLNELRNAFHEAGDAITIGSQYIVGTKVFEYRRLLLERFLSTVSPKIGEEFGAIVFTTRTARLFGDEMVHTIEVFFENNLNLSEAARKLYIHRNTLVYRLEKVQRLTGFDLRQFDDAVTFKLMMLLNKGVIARKPHQ